MRNRFDGGWSYSVMARGSLDQAPHPVQRIIDVFVVGMDNRVYTKYFNAWFSSKLLSKFYLHEQVGSGWFPDPGFGILDPAQDLGSPIAPQGLAVVCRYRGEGEFDKHLDFFARTLKGAIFTAWGRPWMPVSQPPPPPMILRSTTNH